MAEADKNAYTPRLRKHYDEVVRQKPIEEFGYKNPMEVPQITKIVINMGVGESTADSKKASVAAGDLARAVARAVVDDSVDSYTHERDRLSVQLFDVVDDLASYRWNTTDVQRLLLALSSAMTEEIEALLALDHRKMRTLSA